MVIIFFGYLFIRFPGPVAVVFYVKEKVSEEEIIELMLKEKLTITYDNGVVEKVDNPYVFKEPEIK